jgi:hypothetical protein
MGVHVGNGELEGAGDAATAHWQDGVHTPVHVAAVAVQSHVCDVVE